MPLSHLSDWINPIHLSETARADYAARVAASPARMLVLDNFLVPERYRALQTVLREAGELTPQYALYGRNRVRASREEWLAAPEPQRFYHHLEVTGPRPGHETSVAWLTHVGLCQALASRPFLDYFGGISGERLAGVGRVNGKIIGDGQFLRPHSDAEPGRRCCAVLYLNDDWRPEYGGRFLLYRDDREIDRIDPVGNRLLLFVPDSGYLHAVAPMTPAAAGWQRLNYTFWLADDSGRRPAATPAPPPPKPVVTAAAEHSPRLRLDVVRRLRDGMAAGLRPDSPPTTLFRLAELDRAVGDLAAAEGHYAAYLRHCPEDRQARALQGIMAGRPEPLEWAAGESRPTPFVRLQEFLPEAELAALWAMLTARRDELRSAGPEVGALLLPRVRAAIAEHDLVRRFALPPIRLEGVAVDLVSSRQGCHFQPHREKAGRQGQRSLTFVFSLFREPPGFQGGDLLIRDDLEAGTPSLGYTRHTPVNNGMVLFPSDRHHQIQAVTCASDDPLDGRLSVHGWFAPA